MLSYVHENYIKPGSSLLLKPICEKGLKAARAMFGNNGSLAMFLYSESCRRATFLLFLIILPAIVRPEDCRLQPVLHVLQSPGCTPRSIPSFACVGKCTSYVQVSGSKLWQTERSCMCCQESGEREATVMLSCPKAPRGQSQTQKVVTKAPVDCMCRPCTVVEEGSVLPQEMAGYLESDGSPSFSVRLRL